MIRTPVVVSTSSATWSTSTMALAMIASTRSQPSSTSLWRALSLTGHPRSMTTSTEPVQTLRARILAALPNHPGTTADALAEAVDVGQSRDRQVRRALAQLEAAGLARRQTSRQTGDGRIPDRWSAAPP